MADEQHGEEYDEQPRTGECGCGALTDYYGPDPFSSEMCATYSRNTPCVDCTCWEEYWICDDCYTRSVQDI